MSKFLKNGCHVTHRIMRWIPPPIGWYTFNTDSVLKDNHGPNVNTICARNNEGDTLGVNERRLSDFTDLIIEVVAISEGV